MTTGNSSGRQNRIALVTGGSRGLGKDIALSLGSQGVDIVLTYHVNKTGGDGVAQEIRASGGRAVALQLDVSQTSSFVAFFEQARSVMRDTFGTEKLDFLINNAGLVALLCSDDARWLTGQRLEATGGFNL